MRRLGVFGAAVALVVAFGASGACAQTATTEPAGKPLALLAGLRPPHEARHRNAKHVVHTVSRVRVAHKKSAARTRHTRISAAHASHASSPRLARRDHERHGRKYEHREQPVTASAFAEEPPVQAALDATPDNPMPASVKPAANEGSADSTMAPAAEAAFAPMPQRAPASGQTGNGNAEPAAAIPTVKITAASENAGPAPAIANAAASAATPNAVTSAAAPTAMAAAAQEQRTQEQRTVKTDPVGSASWIAQVLAALGGAVTAGAVAWFLIGGGPARTYG
jgi:hypothetical protein